MKSVSKYGVFSGPYFPVFGLNTGKYGPEKTPHLGTFHAVKVSEFVKSEQIKNYAQLLATAEKRENAGQTDLVDYIFNHTENNLQEIVKKNLANGKSKKND